MGTRKSKRLVLLALTALAATIAGALFAANVSAGGTASLTVESDRIAPGDQTTVAVTAEVPNEPGLGAWTVDVMVESPNQVSIVDCNAPAGSVCNPDYPGDLPTVRFAGAAARGMTGSIEIGTITVECANRSGSSVLSLSTAGFADGTLGHPQEIPVVHNPGTITCREAAAAATRTPRPTPTTAVSGMPEAGFGGSSGGSSALLFAALAAAAIAGLAGFGALRIRQR